jgi:hypothetical protein
MLGTRRSKEMAERRCVHCGQAVGPEQTWICDHCGKLFAGEAAEQQVRENAELGRAQETERREHLAARTESAAPEPPDIGEQVVSVRTGSETAGLEDPLTDVLRPTTEAGGSGKGVEAFEKPVEYKAFQGDDLRYGWTLEPDSNGRYHSLTLHEHSDGSWEVTADEVFESQERARRWAERKYRESSGVATGA